ncbi:MAG: 16S rRNA (guanine(527)-N(7))-methyltransferase RsmG [Mesorhizobium sp.]
MSDRYRRLCEVAGPVSRETFARLEAFERLFQKWNASINLVAPSTVGDAWERHILDSAQLFRLSPSAIRWVDIGSGGGFPGLILAILLREREGAEIHLIESNRKKASFLQTVTGQFDLPAKVHAKRVEDCYSLVDDPEVATVRAVAPLPALLTLVAPWLGKKAVGLFHKGRDYQNEVAESALCWSFDLVEHRSSIDPQSVVLEIRTLQAI